MTVMEKTNRIVELTYEVIERQKKRAKKGYTITPILANMPSDATLDERIEYLEDLLLDL